MRLTIFTACGLIALMASPAIAWDEPDAVRGVPWHASMAEAQAKLAEAGDRCEPTRLSPSCMLFHAKVGPVPGVTFFYGFGNADQLEDVRLMFPTEHFGSLLVIFTERYGSPTETKQVTVQNKLGATYTNDIVRWNGERVLIELTRYGSKLTEGAGRIALQETMARHREEAVKALKKGKDDL